MFTRTILTCWCSAGKITIKLELPCSPSYFSVLAWSSTENKFFGHELKYWTNSFLLLSSLYILLQLTFYIWTAALSLFSTFASWLEMNIWLNVISSCGLSPSWQPTVCFIVSVGVCWLSLVGEIFKLSKRVGRANPTQNATLLMHESRKDSPTEMSVAIQWIEHVYNVRFYCCGLQEYFICTSEGSEE